MGLGELEASVAGTPHVTIGVPVYKGELFIEETLRSIQAQTYRHLEVVISLDGPQPISEERLKPFLRDSRFRMVVHAERRGWVGNVNWLMEQAETPYWCCLPQDDLVAPRYVETLLLHAQRYPEAAVVYCDIVGFGTQSPRYVQPSVTGSAFARQFVLLHEHHAAVAFRGLTRVEALRHAGSIRANEVESFSTDTTWMAAMARWGDLQRLPVPWYQKRYHANNEHLKWNEWTGEKKTRAWMTHCVDMLEQAMLASATTHERRVLWLAGVGRLWASRFGFLPASRSAPGERESLLGQFVEYLKTVRYLDIPGCLDDRWGNIRRWTEVFFGPGAHPQE